jgi:hypothetical protein
MDRVIADGGLQEMMLASFPLVLGADLAGVIEAVIEEAPLARVPKRQQPDACLRGRGDDRPYGGLGSRHPRADAPRRHGLLARHDYEVEISGGTLAAHYVSDYADVAGIKLPTKHRIFPRNPDGQTLPEPLVVSIDLSEIALTSPDRPRARTSQHAIPAPRSASRLTR